MTAQTPNLLLAEGKSWDIGGTWGEELFAPSEHGLTPQSVSTMNHAGWLAQFELKADRILLVDFSLDSPASIRTATGWVKTGRDRRPTLFGIPPSEVDRSRFYWKEIRQELPFTGGVMACSKHIADYRSWSIEPVEYQHVVEFMFDRGVLCERIDMSEVVREVRSKGFVEPSDADPEATGAKEEFYRWQERFPP